MARICSGILGYFALTMTFLDVSSFNVCQTGPVVENGKVEYDSRNPGMATIVCDPGYASMASFDTFQKSFVVVCSRHGQWTMPDGLVHLSKCTKKNCPTPPEVPKARYRYLSNNNPSMTDGLQVEYLCTPGYVLIDPSNAHLTCLNGQWEGPIPTCIFKATCKAPSAVENAQWNLLSPNGEGMSSSYEQQGDAEYPRFDIGAEVEYTCKPGFKIVGRRVLRCGPSQIWSSDPPLCIPKSERTWYCPDVGQIEHGFCKCVGEDIADLQLCMPFHRGAQIDCTCVHGYKLQGMSILTCTHSSSLNIGVWDWDVPKCYKDFSLLDGNSYSESGEDIDFPDEKNDRKSYNSGDISDGKNKVSSLAIVVTTACSVLGVLLLIMVIVVFRRKKPRAHLFQQGPTPPPYARVHNNSMDEHDRMALMAYADTSRIHLPSYEESMRAGGNNTVRGGPGVGGGPSAGRSASPTSSEYRRLPNVHPAVRAANLQHQQAVGGDGNNNINNNNNNNSNRHSIATTSTMNRDGVSEIFGSLDTVNVSMSDASTSVTVETFDSGTSNRSIASQRATAGSLNSSDDQLANVNDDAPLLDSSPQRELDGVSVHSTPSRTSKEDQ